MTKLRRNLELFDRRFQTESPSSQIIVRNYDAIERLYCRLFFAAPFSEACAHNSRINTAI